MALYSVSVIVTAHLYNRFEPEGTAALALAMIPMVPTLLALWAFLRQFWRTDELERRIVAEAVLIAAGVVGFLSFALGWAMALLQPGGEMLTYLPLLLFLPAMIMVWGVALPFVRRRYQ